MRGSKTLTCRIFYPHERVMYGSMAVLFAVYFAEIFFFAAHHPDPLRQWFFSFWICFGIGLPLTIPFIISGIRSSFTLTNDGIVERRGYFWGLFKTDVHLPWSRFQSWNNTSVYIPMEKKAIPQISLYYAQSNQSIRFNERMPVFESDGKSVRWSTFSQHLVNLFSTAGLPHETPSAEQKKKKIFTGFIIVSGLIALLGIVIYFILLGVKVLLNLELFNMAGLVIIVVLLFFGVFIFKRQKW